MKKLLGFVVVLAPLVSFAGNWPQWRGPFANGSTDETGLPESCDPAKAKWVAPMPGASHATPVIWGDRVFVTSTDPASKGLSGLCVSAGDGKILWQKRLGDEIKAPQNNGATPSPVTDGKLVAFLFGSGDLAALDMEGNLKWSKNLVKEYGNFGTKFGYSSSPLLWNGKLHIQILRRNKPYSGAAVTPLDSMVLAFDFQTGKELWKQVRKSEARDESFESYASPVPFENKARNELLIQGGDCISGHDPATGAEFWRMDYNPVRETNWRLIPSPVAAGDLILAMKPRGGSLLAVKAGGNGNLGPDALAWTYDERTSDSGTPLVYQGLVYILQSDKTDRWARGSKSSPGIYLLAVDPATGREAGRCQISTGGAWRSSPTGADGRIYVMSEEGEVVVVSAGASGKILSRAAYADGPACSSLSIANGCVFVRTEKKLTCITK